MNSIKGNFLLSQQMLDAIKHFRKIAHRCTVCNTIKLSEICDFRVSAICQVVQKHKLFEVA